MKRRQVLLGITTVGTMVIAGCSGESSGSSSSDSGNNNPETDDERTLAHLQVDDLPGEGWEEDANVIGQSTSQSDRQFLYEGDEGVVGVASTILEMSNEQEAIDFVTEKKNLDDSEVQNMSDFNIADSSFGFVATPSQSGVINAISYIRDGDTVGRVFINKSNNTSDTAIPISTTLNDLELLSNKMY